MGSFGNQNYPWAPFNNNNNYRSADCSEGVCSLYCPQFCYFFFPPPPPSNDDSTPLSPLIIAVIGVLATAFLLASYYTVVTRYCNRRRQRSNNSTSSSSSTTTINHSAAGEQTQCRAGLDESVIRAIGVRAYRKGGLGAAAAECAVCLSEFREEEPLRLLPKCGHAFHLPCIDTWLASQSTCPLCRAAVVGPGSQRVDFVLEVVDDDDVVGTESTVMLGNDEEEGEGIVVIKRLGRSVSLRIIGRSEEEEEDCVRMMTMMKRSVSTGGLTFTVHDGGGGTGSSRGKD